MKVLHVTDSDLPARRFNGYDLIRDMQPLGFETKQVVLRKLSRNPAVIALASEQGDALLLRRLGEAEHDLSLNALLAPWGSLLAELPAFAEADVVHYHLIHNQVLSLYDLPRLFRMKPSVWTFHDPWPLTGHCIHPIDSTGWLTGCTPCPYLDRLFPLRRDRAGELWRAKMRVYNELEVDVVVASEWMLDLVRRSPLTSRFKRVHLIPFGVDSTLFTAEKLGSRKRLSIGQEEFVLLVRASPWEVKGLDYFISALAEAPPRRPTTVIAVDGRGLLDRLRNRYTIMETGWVDDPHTFSRLYAAADAVVIPSIAESFGLMGVEAMASGTPVVCFEGTALPGVTHAPECGVAVPRADPTALRAALDRLAADPEEISRRGAVGRAIAASAYGHDRYLESLADTYRAALGRHGHTTDVGP